MIGKATRCFYIIVFKSSLGQQTVKNMLKKILACLLSRFHLFRSVLDHFYLFDRCAWPVAASHCVAMELSQAPYPKEPIEHH